VGGVARRRGLSHCDHRVVVARPLKAVRGSEDERVPHAGAPDALVPDSCLALAVGFAYLAAVWFDQYTVQFLLGTVEPDAQFIHDHGDAVVFASTATRLFGLGLVVWLIRSRPNGQLRAALRLESARWLSVAIFLTLVTSALLSGFKQYGGSVVWVRALAESGHWQALVVWVMVSAGASPLIEEVIFRFGLLQSLRRWSCSLALSVVLSAVVFGAFHLGYAPWRAAPVAIRTAISTGVFGLVLGTIVARNDGRISGSIAIHSSYNLISCLGLLMYTWVDQGAK
jgi:membrane protease YdiL (CAAX protease family)